MTSHSNRRHCRTGKTTSILVALGIGLFLSISFNGCQTAGHVTKSLRITDGVAVSLNNLERSGEKFLPPMDITGITIDRDNNDSVIIGNRNPKAKPLPVDVITVALSAARHRLEAPGVDIRPVSAENQKSQAVTYFGPGVEQSIVGSWFFVFDYWMKQAALGDAPVIDKVPVYWTRVIKQAESQDLAKQAKEQPRGTRFWLCAGDFDARVEDGPRGSTLIFDRTPLHVYAERLQDAASKRKAPPCATQGADDKFAGEFAKALDANLDNVAHLTPISEIKSFARLYTGFIWAMELNPNHRLDPKLAGPITPVDTPTLVPTIEKQHEIVQQNDRFIRKLRLYVAGGVTIHPRVVKQRGYDPLLRLQRAVLEARPGAGGAIWSFIFDSSAKN